MIDVSLLSVTDNKQSSNNMSYVYLSLYIFLSLTDAVEKKHVEDAHSKRELKSIAGHAAISGVAGRLAGTGVEVGVVFGAVMGSIIPGPKIAIGTAIRSLSGSGVFEGVGAGIGAGVAAKKKSK